MRQRDRFVRGYLRSPVLLAVCRRTTVASSPSQLDHLSHFLLSRLRRSVEVFGFIEGSYNTRRSHTALGYISPADVEELHHPA